MRPVRISTARLQLREITTDDADALLAVYGDPAVTQHLSFEPRSRCQVADIAARFSRSARAEPRTEYGLVVTPKDSDEPIGIGRLATDAHQPRAATIGFALRADTWGRGLGTETVHLMLQLAFDELHLHRVWAACSPHNTASHRTLLRAGMAEEGRIRGHIPVRGSWRDSITYGILEEEWRGRARG